MQKIRIKYFTDKIDKLEYIVGKSDWIDLRASETVEVHGVTAFLRIFKC